MTRTAELPVDRLPLLRVDRLSVRFPLRTSGFGRGRRFLDAVRDVSLHVDRGETLGLVGESGSGKTTIGRAILRLVPIADGSIHVDDIDVGRADASDLRRLRSQAQVVFQDPYSSLNPVMTVGAALAESLRHHGMASRDGARDAAAALLARVGLPAEYLDRYPQEFSGGQRQRIAIARALAPQPRLLVCDEPVSALDVSTQAQVVNLFADLKTDLGVAMLFIAHDLSVVRHLSDRIAVLYLGRLVEIGRAAQVCDEPAHPYTRALLASVPDPNPVRQRARRLERSAASAPGSSTRHATGCPFQDRCPHVMDVCRSVMPPVVSLPDGGAVACHLHLP